MGTLDESRGPLGPDVDQDVRKEIGKLWTTLEGRLGYDGTKADHQLVTFADLTNTSLQLHQRIDNIDTSPALGSGQGGDGGGGGGLDLRPLNNKWTGTNVWTRGELVGVNNFSFLDLTSGPITSFTTPGTILLESKNYQAAIDVQKSSESSIFQGINGGNAAIYVQHRGGGAATKDVGIYAIRAHAESITTSGAGVGNSVAAGYFIMQNATTSGIGWGIKVDVMHKAVAGYQGGTSYGVEANLFRKNLDGKTIGFHARAGYGGSDGTYTQDNDWGFLASPFYGGLGKILTAFGAGSDFAGRLICDFGLDLAFASCDKAAIRLQQDKYIQMNGPSKAPAIVGFKYMDPGKIQFVSDIGPTVAIGNDGQLYIRANKALQLNDGDTPVAIRFNSLGAIEFYVSQTSNPIFQFGTDGTFIVNNPRTEANAGGVIGYWVVNLGGFLRKIEFKAM